MRELTKIMGACALFALAAPANAADVSPYVSGKYGYGVSGWTGADYLPYGAMYAGAVGAVVKTDYINFRAEAEYTGHNQKASVLESYGTFPTNDVERDVEPTEKFIYKKLNLYIDFLEEYVLKPYIGAGIGQGKVEESIKRFDNSGNYVRTDSASLSAITYSYYTGVGFKILYGLSADLGIHVNNTKIPSDLYVFGVNAGLRYTF